MQDTVSTLDKVFYILEYTVVASSKLIYNHWRRLLAQDKQ